MPKQIQTTEPQVYQTITGGRIWLAGLSDTEYSFLDVVANKYNARQDWTRFAAWWNAKFKASGLTTASVVYRICQDLEARLGINQRKVSPPDYRDYLDELINAQFKSRQEFCGATGVDPGQLSRVLANRDNLSMKVLRRVMDVLRARLVIQTEEVARAHTSIEGATEAISVALASRTKASDPEVGPVPPMSPVGGMAIENVTTIPADWRRSFPNVDELNEVAARARAVADSEMPLMISDAA